MDYGALDVSLYYDRDVIYETEDVTSLYQTEYDDNDANHCVTIIGWDDDFQEFGAKDAPRGAWLAANSYGADYNGMDGCFWVSYYDSSLCELYSLEGEAPDTYDTNFQYDGNGWGEVFYDSDPITLANVFTNGSDVPKSIDAVTFYTICDHQDYEIQIYRNQNGASPVHGNKITDCSTGGRIEHSGYHTVSLPQSIAVAPGESFSVLVTYRPNSYADGNAYAPVEGAQHTELGYEFQSKAGQSYIRFASEGIWHDQTSIDTDGETLNMNNACIKALAHSITTQEYEEQEKKYALMTPLPSPDAPTASHPAVSPEPGHTASPSPAASSSASTATPPTGVHPIPSAAAPSFSPGQVDPQSPTVSAAKIQIGKGETVSFPKKAKPASSANRLTYQSSNTGIATVNRNGRIKGRKTGQTWITVSSENGLTKKLTVVVRKAPARVRLTAKKTVLKKGQTTRAAIRLPRGSASYQRRFSSSSPAVATINSDGRIRARKSGQTWITVRCYNGKQGRVKIRVL